jgi:hypothetical protein
MHSAFRHFDRRIVTVSRRANRRHADMSFDVFVSFFHDAEPISRPRQIVENLGLRHNVDWSNGNTLIFHDGSTADIYGAEAAELDGMTFSHFGGMPFLEFLFALADEMEAVFYWPGSPPYVTRQRHAFELPEDLTNALGRPQVLTDAHSIAAALQSTWP